MNKYITYLDFEEYCLCHEVLSIPKGTSIITDGEGKNELLISPNNKAICLVNSFLGRRYFAYDTDGNGAVRGELIYLIEFKNQAFKIGCRLGQKEQSLMYQFWPQYIDLAQASLIFNDAFYKAPIRDLENIADMINVY